MKISRLVLVSALALIAQPALADVLGLGNGRLANLDGMAAMSVEVGYTHESDSNVAGGRVNFKISPDMMVFVGAGKLTIDIGDGDELGGNAFGGGVFYQMRDLELLENTDFAVKFSYHTAAAKAKCGPLTECSDGDITELALEGVISGDQLSNTSFGWYANVGMHKIDIEGGDDDTEPGFGFGIVGPVAMGEWYLGLDNIDDTFIRAGFRYNLQ